MGLEQIAQSHVNEYSSLKAQCLLRIEAELQKTRFAVESKEHRKRFQKIMKYLYFILICVFSQGYAVIPTKAVGKHTIPNNHKT